MWARWLALPVFTTSIVAIKAITAWMPESPSGLLSAWGLLILLGVYVILVVPRRLACPHCGEAYFARKARVFGMPVTRWALFERHCMNCRVT